MWNNLQKIIVQVHNILKLKSSHWVVVSEEGVVIYTTCDYKHRLI